MVFTNGMAEAEWQRQQYINELNCAQQEQKCWRQPKKSKASKTDKRDREREREREE